MFTEVRLMIQKDNFMKAGKLMDAMEDYSNDDSVENRLKLEFFAKDSENLPLPSNRIGNAIALALEINDYICAEYLINNAEELGLSTKNVVSDIERKYPWTLKEEYLYSQLTIDKLLDEAILRDKESNVQDTSFILRNREANNRLASKLIVSKEDQMAFRKVSR